MKGMRTQTVMLTALMVLLSGVAVSNCSKRLEPKPVVSQQANADAAALNVQLGMNYLRQGEVQRAQMKFLQAQKQAPNDITVINGLAYFYSQTGQRDKAKHYYQYALKKNPHSGQAHNNYGVFLCQHDDHQEGVKHFVAATKDSRYLKSAEAFENAGLCALKMNEVANAWQFFQFAHQRDPKRASVLLELSRIALQEGKVSQAQRYLDGYEKLAGPTPLSNQLTQRIQAVLAARETNATR